MEFMELIGVDEVGNEVVNVVVVLQVDGMV